MTVEYPVKRKDCIVDKIARNVFIEMSIEYAPIFKLRLIRRNGERPPYTHDIVGQSVTRLSLDTVVLGSDAMVREVATYLFEKANEEGFEVELTDELMILILNYKNELIDD